MKNVILFLIMAIISTISFTIGRYDVFTDVNGKTHFYSYKECYHLEVKYANCLFSMLHEVWENDKDYYSKIVESSQAYKNACTINKGDWEDFYTNW